MVRAVRSIALLPVFFALATGVASAQEPCPDPAFATNISWRPLDVNVVQLIWSKSQAETTGSQTSFTIEVGSGPGLSDVAVIPPASVVQTNTHASLALNAGTFYIRLLGGRTCSSVRIPSEEITVIAGQPTGSSQVRVNEIGMRAGTTPAALEFIELKNFGSTTANIGNWRIFSGSFNAAIFAATVPAGVTVPAGCTYLVVRNGSGLAGDLTGNDLRGRSAAVVDSTGRIRDSVAATEDNDGGQQYPLAETNPLANQSTGSFERTSSSDSNNNTSDFGYLATATPQNSVQCGGTGNFPGAPSSLAAFVTGSSVTLTWTPPTSGLPLTHYVLELGSTPGGSQFAPLNLSAALTSITFIGAPNGTFYARLRAANAQGLSPASNEAVIVVCTAGCTVPPGAPTNLAASVNGSNVLLTWRRPTVGAAPTGYVLEAGTASGLANLGTFPTGSTNDFTLVTGVPPGTYFVRVRAIAGTTTGAGSNEVVIVVQ
jgi:hypothetical protein